MSEIANSFSLPALSEAVADVVRGAARSVVGVHSRRARGSGFLWRRGLVVTADEALADEGDVEVDLPGGERVPASIKGRDASTDIALLDIGRPIEPAMQRSADPVEAGALAIVVGAIDAAPTAALGIVSRAGASWTSLRGGKVDARIELDLRLRASAEGGLVLDAAGHTIGMAVFGPRRRVLVIPTRTIERVAATLDAEGRIARGYLGLGLQPVRIDGDNRRAGAMVMSVDAAGPGAVAGLRQGDVIVRWNGEPLEGIRALLRELGPASVGTMVRLSATRAGDAIEFDVAVAARPDD